MLKQSICTILLLLIAWQVSVAQVLPRGLSESEKRLVDNGLFQKATSLPGAFTQSLGVSARTMAEWEEIETVVITWIWFDDILAEIVRAVQKECKVLIICENASVVRSRLLDRAIDPDLNTDYIESPFNTIWVRDYGPNPVYKTGVDSLVLIDWIYNRPRPDDDKIPLVVGSHLGLPVYSTTSAPNDLVHTGGNFMSDGLGTGFSSNLVLHENDETNNYGISNHSEEDIDMIMQQFMGIDPYVKMPVLPYDGIHHIDMHMKLLDEETLLVGEYPEGVADGPQIEANLQYVLQQFRTKYDKPFEVIRIPMPPSHDGKYPDQNGHYRTYTNALFVNKTVIVPTYDEQFDTIALRIWQDAMPGYEIVGIDCNDIIPLGGAIHCITKEVGASEPLLIQHARVREANASEPVDITAQIMHRSGVDKAFVYFRYSGSTQYDSLQMDSEDGYHWIGSLDGVLEGTTIEYYILATATNGKTQVRPMSAPEGYFAFDVMATTHVQETPEVGLIQMRIFPNPASAISCIPVVLPMAMEVDILMLDVTGREAGRIFSGALPQGESKLFLHANNYAPGTYILQLRTGQIVLSHKIVIY